jgi:hypothetical protein
MTKRTNNDLQDIAHKTKDRVTQIPIKTRGELRCSISVSIYCSTSGTCHVNLVTNPVLGMNEERFGKCVLQVSKIWGHL